MEDNKPTGELNIEETVKAGLKSQDDKIGALQIISLGIIIVLFMGFVSLIATLDSIKRDADEFKSQIFIDLIKETKDTNSKINMLIK
jgi:hypothetical protein